MRIGIDASNIRVGGGLTHLLKLLEHCQPHLDADDRVIVWGAAKALRVLPTGQPWLECRHAEALDRNLFRRLLWRTFSLPGELRESCDVVLVPGGASISTAFSPSVAMSQNMLPFEWKEIRRYGFSIMAVKMVALRFVQSRTFRNAAAVIFLSEFARREITRKVGGIAHAVVIPHGIDMRFVADVREQLLPQQASAARPFRLLYVSVVDVYKHQDKVIAAVRALRRAGLPVSLTLVGACTAQSKSRFDAALQPQPEDGDAIQWKGQIGYEEIHRCYQDSDAFVYASTCENLPIILLEAVASGLPIASSSYGPMPEVLQQDAVYFDPEDVSSIAAGIRELMENPALRQERAHRAQERILAYSWDACARATLACLREVRASGSKMPRHS